ncbi:MAG: GIY-YIG nuclease family protein [Selenomonadaceae bacterium]|nr:GIY-YIG nuclease family protein [Selenomonadaceae bacterium]
MVAVLVLIKGGRFDKYCTFVENSVSDELNRAHISAEKIVADAKTQAVLLVDEAKEKFAAHEADAQKILSDAKTQAEATVADARKKNSELACELERIQAEIDKREFYLSEVERVKAALVDVQKKQVAQQNKLDSLMRLRKVVNSAVQKYLANLPTFQEQTIALPGDVVREVETLAPSVILKLHALDYKDLRRAFRGNEKLIEDTLTRYESRYTTKTNKAIYRLMVIGLRAELQNILYTLTSSKLSDALDKVGELTNKYLNVAREGNQTISSTLAKFVGEMDVLFRDAVKIEYEYFVKREAARQEQLELRAKMREEAKFHAQIDKLLTQANESSDDDKNQALLDKIRELELQLFDLSAKKDEIISLQNGKAGYVYVISNLGAFGSDVFKIGMTRRLDPQERIDELSGASVPFKFDVHSFIFSDDAVKLESDLHAALNSRRLNKVNLCKEFFKIPIDELEKLVETFDPAAEFNRTMQAEQYYQSLSVEM